MKVSFTAINVLFYLSIHRSPNLLIAALHTMPIPRTYSNQHKSKPIWKNRTKSPFHFRTCIFPAINQYLHVLTAFVLFQRNQNYAPEPFHVDRVSFAIELYAFLSDRARELRKKRAEIISKPDAFADRKIQNDAKGCKRTDTAYPGVIFPFHYIENLTRDSFPTAWVRALD